MRLKTFSLLTLIALCCTTQAAYARNGYFGFRGGVTDTHEKDVIDDAVSTGFGSAYIGAYSGPFRGEIEYTYASRADYDETSPDTEAQFQRVTANAYLDVPITRYVRPYIGGGVGTAIYKVKDTATELEETGNNFSWNATAGIGIKLTRNLTFDSGYRYVDMGNVEINNNEMNFAAHEAYAGVRFLF